MPRLPDPMSELFASGRIVGFILAFMALEAVVLIVYRRRTGRGVAPGELVPNLLAGVFLLLALGGALSGAWWGWIALALAASLAAHLADLRRRARSTIGEGTPPRAPRTQESRRRGGDPLSTGSRPGK